MEDEPKWRQLAAILQARIESGEYQPGTPIPSEHELVREFSVSRSTVQKAVQSLKDAGIIRGVQGLGTFVRRTP